MKTLLAAMTIALFASVLYVSAPAVAQVGACANIPGKGIICPSPYTYQKGVRIPTTTIGALPTCAAATSGLIRTVSNGASSPTGGATVSATGSTIVPVFCDGTNWVYVW